jgi:hypothetical protein
MGLRLSAAFGRAFTADRNISGRHDPDFLQSIDFPR